MEYVGRIDEIKEIKRLELSSRSEFLVIYGRRRIGKTQLVRSLYLPKLAFYATGLANGSLSDQLSNFHSALIQYGLPDTYSLPANWLEAFKNLKILIQKSKAKRKIIFIDELPWFDTQNSKFLSAFEHFWNSWASGRRDIFMIGCGSAASWMLNNLIRNKGGLHNRVTAQLKILPFTLAECKLFVDSRKLKFTHYQILQLYMVFGGVPFYWEQVRRGESVTQAIQNSCFGKQALLKAEFDTVFRSLFAKADRHIQIVKALAARPQGLTRNELGNHKNLSNGGGLTRLLEELEESGFVHKFIPYGKKTRDTYYKLCDYFCHFYLKFMTQTTGLKDENFWIKSQDSPSFRSWSGLAFERICLDHIPQIKKALGIAGILSTASAWRSPNMKSGSQIDLLIDRADQVITLCELKFYANGYSLTKKEVDALRIRKTNFQSETETKKALFMTMISPYPIANLWKYDDLIQSQITADDLFT